MSWRRRLFTGGVIVLPAVAALAFGAPAAIAVSPPRCDARHGAAARGNCHHGDRDHDRDDRATPAPTPAPRPTPAPAPVPVPAPVAVPAPARVAVPAGAPAAAALPAGPGPAAAAPAVVASPAPAATASPGATPLPARQPTPTGVAAPRGISLPQARPARRLLDSPLTYLLVVAVIVGGAAGTLPHIVGRRR